MALIKEGKIKMVKPRDKPYSQTHYLVINEKNEFNKIYKSLLEIENIIDSMARYASVIRKLRIGDKEDEESKARFLLNVYYRSLFDPPVEALLHILMVMVTEARLSPNDSEIFYKKIAELLQKQASQLSDLDLTERLDFILNKHIPEIKLMIKQHEKDFKKYASIYNKYHLDFRLQDELLQITNNIKARFPS